MLRYALWFLLFGVASVSLIGQSIGRNLISSSGGIIGHPGGLRISWSIGEVSTGQWSASNGKGKITVGFHQPGWIHDERADPSISVEAAPNPFRDKLHVYISGDSHNQWTVMLTDVNGKTLVQESGLTVRNSGLDLAWLADGVYFLCVSETLTGKIKAALRVIKVQ